MPETFNEALTRWFKGDEDAVIFALQLWEAAQAWDDIEDEGRSDRTDDLMSWLAFGKEYNRFFDMSAHIMRPALLQMFLSWQTANVLERGDDDDLNKAYMLRAGYYQVLHVMTWVIGGPGWSAECGPEIYRTYAETLDELRNEMKGGN